MTGHGLPRARRMRLAVGGVPLDLIDHGDLIRAMEFRLDRHPGPPIAVASVNLDHVRHFGRVRSSAGPLPESTAALRWLHVADGWPTASRANRLTGSAWPLLPGSDVLPDVLALATKHGAAVGILGGTPESHTLLRAALAETYPSLALAGMWSPQRRVIDDAVASNGLADEIAAAGVDVLIVGLGKPRQEVWLARHGVRTGAVVMLPFGAAADFIAGSAKRAPSLIQQLRVEWLWRLAMEPRRLARRYLWEGPRAMLALRHAKVISASPSVDQLPEHVDPERARLEIRDLEARHRESPALPRQLDRDDRAV